MDINSSSHKIITDDPGQKRWYVAIVRNNTEKAVGERLTKAGHICYCPIQQVVRVWRNGRRNKIEKVVIPTVIFIKCNEIQRQEIVRFAGIIRFMTDRAVKTGVTGCGFTPLAVIHDSQISRLRYMLDNAESEVTVSENFKKGDKVHVARGSLRGLDGEIVESGNGTELIVHLDLFGCARVSINASDVEPI